MKLEKLEIQGFKSFYDYQRLEFQPGVTGIVGPNGCGKSNLADAIAWVLGSQSAAQLRGKRMDDLIFNGSRNRKALGMAQVIITLRNENGDFPGRETDILEIGRRLFRTGESEYLLNGRECRLMDIYELIMDTGLGTSVYTVIEQGKIDQILSTNSADRRDLLEEAAGITRFKAKRHQTDLKLQATKQNLVRLYDVMNEIERQVRSLAGQAAKARRYKRLQAELADYQILLYIDKYFNLFGRQEEVLRRISSFKDHEAQTAATLASFEAETEEMKLSLLESEAELNRHKDALFKLEIEANDLRRKSEENTNRAGELAAVIERNASKELELKTRLEERKAALSEQQGALAELEKTLERKEEDLSLQAAELEKKKEEYQKLERLSEETGKKHLETLGELAEVQSLLVKTGTEIEAERLKRSRNKSELDELHQELNAVESSFTEEGSNLKELESELKNLQVCSAKLIGRASALREEISQKSNKIITLRDMITSLTSEINIIRKMQWAEPGRHTAGEYLLELSKSGDCGLEGYLLERVSVAPEYRQTVEGYIEDSVRHFIVDNIPSALKLSKVLSDEKKGKAGFIVKSILEKRTPYRSLDLKTGSPVLTTLHRQLRGHGSFAHLVTRLIPDAYIVEKIITEEILLGLLESGDVITRNGDVFTQRGTLSTGRESGERTGLLDLQEVVRSKSTELDSGRAKLKELEGEDEKLNRQLEEIERERSEVDIRTSETRRRHSVCEEKVRRIEEERSRLRMKLDLLKSEADQIERDEKGLSEKHKTLMEQKAMLDAEKDRLLKEKESIKNRLDSSRAELDTVSRLYTDKQVEFNRLKTERQNSLNNIKYISDAIVEIERQVSEQIQESSDAEKRIEELKSEIISLDESLKVKLDELTGLKGNYQAKEIEVKDKQGRVIEREQYIKTIRRQHDEEIKSINKLEIELTETSVSLRNIEENCQNELGRAIQDFTGLFTAVEISESLVEIEEKNAEVKAKIQKLGEVNPIAFEEYEKTKERLKFYREQEKDLTASIDSLEKVITKLEEESKKRFLEAFQQINANFKEIFSRLFEGGRAELGLPEREDILECPILISAQPPGKRLQNITLLSGGEKAMTSIALLFGIFRYKPSPFCILDEVDATLDEVNTSRFIKMIQEYSDKTQFILITHNKRTMETANVLYGVTMEEPGLSKLVSVSFAGQVDGLKGARA